MLSPGAVPTLHNIALATVGRVCPRHYNGTVCVTLHYTLASPIGLEVQSRAASASRALER